MAAVSFPLNGYSNQCVYQYSYNQAGRVTSQKMSWAMHEFPQPNTLTDKQLSLSATYEWDNQGRMTSLTYPSLTGAGSKYTYQFDALGRVNQITDTGTNQPVIGATYGVAGEILTLGSETRTYNSLFQMTRQTVPGQMDVQYVYTVGANNGRIAKSIDGVTGETVDYTYDVWNRLSKAETEGTTGVQWGQAYAYDGYGNLTDKTATKGSAPTFHATINPLTNGAPTSWGQTAFDGSTDVEWRPKGSTFNGQTWGWGQSVGAHVYDQAGKRVMSWTGPGSGYWYAGTWEFAMYGIGGQRLLTVSCTYNSNVNSVSANCVDGGKNMYFGGKLIRSRGVNVVTDRLGSVRANGNGEQFAYYPYGEERTATADGREKWGTYTRDGSGVDYADQRYYNVGTGRFNVPDPYQASAGRTDPPSWNRYAYTLGDPVNFHDRRGLREDAVGSCGSDSNSGLCMLDDGTGNGAGFQNDPTLGGGGCILDGVKTDCSLTNPDASVMVPPGVLATPGLNLALSAMTSGSCQSLFGMGSVSPTTLFSQVQVLYATNPDPNLDGRTFAPNEAGNPNPGQTTIVIYTSSTDNTRGGPAEIANTIIHELIHVAVEMGYQAPPLWTQFDGGDHAAEVTNNNMIVNNCGVGSLWH